MLYTSNVDSWSEEREIDERKGLKILLIFAPFLQSNYWINIIHYCKKKNRNEEKNEQYISWFR